MPSRMSPRWFLSDAELERFMAAVRERRHVHQPRDHALFALLANTGIRPSEALALTRADVHLEGREPWIRIIRKKKRKTVPEIDDLQITTALAEIVQTHAGGVTNDGGPLFLLSKRQLERLFHYYAKLSGIAAGRWLYSLRHTAATRIYRATRDIKVVQAILGHERPDVTCLYVHITRSLLREACRRMPVVV